jgi:hypothetical protein
MTAMFAAPRAFKLTETLQALETRLRNQRRGARAAVEAVAGFTVDEKALKAITERAAVTGRAVRHGKACQDVEAAP